MLASFYVARQILSGFTSVIAGSLRNVFFAHSARVNDIAETRNRAMRMLKLLTYLLAPTLAFALFRIQDMVSLAAGSKWPNLSAMAWFCMFPAMIAIFTGPLGRVFDLVGRQRLSVVLQLASDAVTLTTIALAIHYSASPQTLVGLISTVLVLYNTVWLCFTLSAMAVPFLQIARVFARFAFVFALCVAIQWPLAALSSTLLSWIASILFLGLSIVPGAASFSMSFPFFRSRLNSRLANGLQKLI
jgi:O-antigen/teichoic acid export membrane protein